jgi:hypothetical protein
MSRLIAHCQIAWLAGACGCSGDPQWGYDQNDHFTPGDRYHARRVALLGGDRTGDLLSICVRSAVVGVRRMSRGQST